MLKNYSMTTPVCITTVVSSQKNIKHFPIVVWELCPMMVAILDLKLPLTYDNPIFNHFVIDWLVFKANFCSISAILLSIILWFSEKILTYFYNFSYLMLHGGGDVWFYNTFLYIHKHNFFSEK